MKQLLFTSLTALALTILLGGCSGSSKSTEFDADDPNTEVTRVEEVEIEDDEVEVETDDEGDGNPLAFWQWGKKKEEIGTREEVSQPDRHEEVEVEAEDKYSEFAVTEKKEGKWYAPWTWSDGDDGQREVEVEVEDDEFEYEEEKKDGFLGLGKKDDGPKRITEREVLGNMSPELHSLAETKGEGKIRIRRTWDTNARMIHDDLRMIFLLDRPSRLSMYPIP